MSTGENEFIIDTKGSCFLCLNKIADPVPMFKTKAEGGLPSLSSIYSLQYFSRYLNMDMKKVFNERGIVPPGLLAKVERAKLKAELCEECASMTERLSELYRQLEKIEMEMTFYVDMIHGKLLKSGTDQLSRSFGSDFSGKLEIVNSLRNEAARKCSDKLHGKNKFAPQVKVQNQSIKQLDGKRRKIHSRSQSNLNNTPIYSPPANNQDSDHVKIEVDAQKVEPEPGPSSTNCINMEAFENDDNESSNEDLNYNLDNPPLSPAALDFDQSPRVLPTTPMSSFNSKTGKRRCQICSKEFSNSSSYGVHYKAVHLKIRYKCSVCSKEFTSHPNYRRHLRSEHMGIQFKCEVCAKPFKHKFQLQGHLRNTSCGKERPGSTRPTYVDIHNLL